jgi:hypothetical protein
MSSIQQSQIIFDSILGARQWYASYELIYIALNHDRRAFLDTHVYVQLADLASVHDLDILYLSFRCRILDLSIDLSNLGNHQREILSSYRRLVLSELDSKEPRLLLPAPLLLGLSFTHLLLTALLAPRSFILLYKLVQLKNVRLRPHLQMTQYKPKFNIRPSCLQTACSCGPDTSARTRRKKSDNTYTGARQRRHWVR